MQALQGMDDGAHVIYVGTFSKVLFPALRLGYLVVPKLRRMRELYRERQLVLLKAATAELGGLVEFLPSDAGMHLVVRVLNGRSDIEISAAAVRDGIDIVPLSIYYHDSAPQNGLLLGYTGIRPPLIWRGARDLASSMRRNG